MFRRGLLEDIMHCRKLSAQPMCRTGSNLRDEMIEALLFKHEVHMTRSIAMSVQQLEQFANRAVVRYRIRNGDYRIKPEYAPFVTVHDCSLIRAISSGILDIILASRVGLPDVNLDAFNRFSVGVFDRTEH